MIYKLLGASAAVAFLIGLLYLNNQQAVELAIQEKQLGQYSSLVQQMVTEQEEFHVKLEAQYAVTTKHLLLIKELDNEKSSLANDLATNRKRVFVNATCPTNRAEADSSSPAPHVDGVPELNPELRQDYLDFRHQYRLQYAALNDLQAYVKEYCLP